MNELYEKHKEYMKKAQRKGGKYYIGSRARAEAMKLIVRKYRKEFDALVNKLKKEIELEGKND